MTKSKWVQSGITHIYPALCGASRKRRWRTTRYRVRELNKFALLFWNSIHISGISLAVWQRDAAEKRLSSPSGSSLAEYLKDTPTPAGVSGSTIPLIINVVLELEILINWTSERLEWRQAARVWCFLGYFIGMTIGTSPFCENHQQLTLLDLQTCNKCSDYAF